MKQDSIEGATSSLLTSSAASLNRPSFAAPYRPQPFADDEAYREHNELILLNCMHDFAGNTNHPLPLRSQTFLLINFRFSAEISESSRPKNSLSLPEWIWAVRTVLKSGDGAAAADTENAKEAFRFGYFDISRIS